MLGQLSGETRMRVVTSKPVSFTTRSVNEPGISGFEVITPTGRMVPIGL